MAGVMYVSLWQEPRITFLVTGGAATTPSTEGQLWECIYCLAECFSRPAGHQRQTCIQDVWQRWLRMQEALLTVPTAPGVH